MPIPHREQLPTSDANLKWVITDDGSRTLLDSALNETYHSGCGAVAESFVVYLLNSGVHQRLTSGQWTTVLEYGFGTGTAFFLTAALAQLASTRLHYIALEKSLLPADIVASLGIADALQRTVTDQPQPGRPAGVQSSIPSSNLQLLLCVGQTMDDLQLAAPPNQLEVAGFMQTLAWIVEEYLEYRRQLPSDVRGRQVLRIGDHVELELWIGDGRSFPFSDCPPLDAVYFDPFSPESNPELWSDAIFRQLFSSLADSGTLTSYCVKGSVRRALASVGFDVNKLPGPVGGKREVLLAKKPMPMCVAR